jgi:hypothetical protein
MTSISLLPPDLAFQLSACLLSDDCFALLLEGLDLVEHPFVSDSVFSGADNAIADAFGKKANMFQDSGLGQLWERR